MAGTTRERLLQAAIEVIETQGERAVKVRDIAAKANVTEPSIYHFFGDRNGLIEEAHAVRFAQGQTEPLMMFVDGVTTCRTKTEFLDLVRSTLEAAFDPSVAGRRFTRVNVLGSAQSRPKLAQYLAEQQRRLSRVLGDAFRFGQAKGFMRSNVDCDILAVWIIGVTTGRLFIEIDPELADSQEWNSLAIDTVMAALGSPPASLTKWNTPTRR
jgi:AcrR family transcriptional regulator